MAIPISIERKAPTRSRRPKAEHLSMAHPTLPSVNHPHFWVAAHLRNLAERVALEHLRDTMYIKLDDITAHAMYAADHLMEHKIERSTQHVHRAGQLLYAWPGTKLFTNPQARH